MDCRVSPLKETLNLLHYLKISSKQGPRASDFYETSCMQLATLGSHLLLFFCGDYVKEIASLPQLFPAFPSPSKLRERGKKKKKKDYVGLTEWPNFSSQDGEAGASVMPKKKRFFSLLKRKWKTFSKSAFMGKPSLLLPPPPPPIDIKPFIATLPLQFSHLIVYCKE